MPAACPNCDAPLADPPPKFCPDCGQETRVRAPTLGEFIQQFGGAYLSTEGALWRTLKLLVLRPGELTLQYLRGRRKHYVLPLRLYLTISVLVLLALRLLASQALHARDDAVVVEDKPGELNNLSVNLGSGQLGLRDGHYFCEGLPQWVCDRAQRRFGKDAHSMRDTAVGLGERLTSNLGAAMFLLLPAFAAALMAVYWNRGLRYTEHLVFALHVHAFWFLMLAASLPGWDWVTLCAFIVVPLYTMRAMRRVYGGRFAWRLLRAGVVSAAYLAVMVVALTGLSLWALLA